MSAWAVSHTLTSVPPDCAAVIRVCSLPASVVNVSPIVFTRSAAASILACGMTSIKMRYDFVMDWMSAFKEVVEFAFASATICACKFEFHDFFEGRHPIHHKVVPH